MGKRPRRQVILFLVEGDSERKALQNRIAAFFDEIDESIEVFFPEIFMPAKDPEDPDVKIETGGDITQMFSVYPGNYDEKVYELFLRDFFDIEHLLPKDVIKIYQIVDMDGAYIPDDNITEYDDLETDRRPVYSSDGITCQRKESLAKRHRRKRTNLDYLKTKKSIKVKTKTIPFEIYYFSCNLDHFIHHTANLADRDKTIAAQGFSDGYISDTNGFAKVFLEDKDSAKGLSYDDSWEFITQEDSFESLHRHTNFNILIQKLLDQQQS